MDLHRYILSSAELSDLQPKTISLSKQSSTKSFTADERVQPAADLESQNGFSEHLLVFFLNDVPNLVQQFEGKIYEAEAKTGDIALVPAGIPQRWIWTGVAKTMHLRLAQEILAPVAYAGFNNSPPSPKFVPCFRSNAVGLRHVAQALYSELRSGLWDELRIEALVDRLVELILLHHSNLHPKAAPTGKLSPARLNRVLDYIDTYLAYPITLDDLANAVNIDRYWFVKMFRRTTGVPPHRYIVERRVKQALWLLLTTEFSFSVIAHHVGFADQSHLTRHFKRIFGIPPGKVERNAKNVQDNSWTNT